MGRMRLEELKNSQQTCLMAVEEVKNGLCEAINILKAKLSMMEESLTKEVHDLRITNEELRTKLVIIENRDVDTS